MHRSAPYNGKNLKHNGPYNKPEPARRGGEPHWNPVLWCADAGTDENGGGDGGYHGECGGDVILYFKMGWKIPFWESYSTRSRDGGETWSTPSELVHGDKVRSSATRGGGGVNLGRRSCATNSSSLENNRLIFIFLTRFREPFFLPSPCFPFSGRVNELASETTGSTRAGGVFNRRIQALGFATAGFKLSGSNLPGSAAGFNCWVQSVRTPRVGVAPSRTSPSC